MSSIHHRPTTNLIPPTAVYPRSWLRSNEIKAMEKRARDGSRRGVEALVPEAELVRGYISTNGVTNGQRY